MKTVILIFLFILVLILNSEQSDFTLGLENWRSEGDGEFSWEAAMGHPGGCFRVDDDATGDINRAYAPNKFLGDWSGLDEMETLSADIYVVSSSDYIQSNFVFKIKGPSGSAKAILGPNPPFNFWVNYSVAISSSDWTIVSGSWEAILADVRTFIVTAEYTDGNEFVRIDNVNLSADPIDLPVQIGVISDFEEIGYDGWYSRTRSVSRTRSAVEIPADLSRSTAIPILRKDWLRLNLPVPGNS
ncbi:MAG: hypothetical protein H8E57_06535 [Candidatus Cloacimonetes bacterium]|nr:hypothetical protein [Candidatus Cloacimonadota bacterium]